MQRWMLAVLAGAALTTAMPAQAALKSYVVKDLGFSFMAPDGVKASTGSFRGALAGPRQTMVFRSTENNIEYKVTVLTFLQAQAEGGAILGEREYMFQDNKKVLSDTFARVETGKDTVYGRKITIERSEPSKSAGREARLPASEGRWLQEGTVGYIKIPAFNDPNYERTAIGIVRLKGGGCNQAVHAAYCMDAPLRLSLPSSSLPSRDHQSQRLVVFSLRPQLSRFRRNVSMRGVALSYETVREWCLMFGQTYANRLRHRTHRAGDRWHLDEVFLKINGRVSYLWRAVDQDGDVLDISVQNKRDTQ